ncbi:hypothetical protein [Dictyobacter formicarum]|uniref:ABC transmembrane type-1 domain-containing protein n=1 Tax=Dictyobacter formicarum TaxID=2778368 RepID=A0ABQ3VEI8_9CHLR|nr:hypothetical protein [Dictyobacter formicarum]GHO84539.1 hypothetical protein KSZ_25450 [Dictyobacter formicarum]
MPGFLDSIHITNVLGLVMFLVLWIVLCELTHVMVLLWRHEPLLGWAVGPFGLTLMVLREPSLLSLWLDVLVPAVVSGSVLWIGLFTSLSPIIFPHHYLMKFIMIVCGVVLTSAADLVNALRDLRYPLWGEARVLRTMQFLRSNWSQIHFTSFGHSYLRTHFGSNPSELLQMLSL